MENKAEYLTRAETEKRFPSPEPPEAIAKTIQSIVAKQKEDRTNVSDISMYVCSSCGIEFSYPLRKTMCDDCRDKKDKEMYRLEDWADRLNKTKKHLFNIGVGKRYLDSTLNNFKGGEKYISFLRSWLNAPCSLYLFGDCGSGKTHLAAALCRELVIQEKKRSIEFVNASELFLEIRAQFKDGGDEKAIVNNYAYSDILFIDDMGAEKTTDWSRATMYLIIDRRDREMLPTIITSNLSPAEIGQAIDGRISSRISNGKIIEIKMPDYRLKR